ncbi:hypothetical protein H5410_009873 [Solanum commersonii]|uniref:Uncharacterized protein n=1 Tax=Solanum commersonii TaxID=4109 RepID=A0A9J6AKW6_SOLCO|nr:hypothetical protein H5410_009873 [Solanum commersonii]
MEISMSSFGSRVLLAGISFSDLHTHIKIQLQIIIASPLDLCKLSNIRMGSTLAAFCIFSTILLWIKEKCSPYTAIVGVHILLTRRRVCRSWKGRKQGSRI